MSAPTPGALAPWCTQERETLLASQRTEVAALLAARSTAETDFLERLVAQADTYQQQLETLRVCEGEERQQLKVKSVMSWEMGLLSCTAKGGWRGG